MTTVRTAPAALRSAVAVLAVFAVSGGCSRADAGGDPAGPFPPRPADLRVSGVPACEAVDGPGAAELGIVDRLPDPRGQGANTCVLSAPDGQTWQVRVQPGIPARQYVPGQEDFLGDSVKFVEQRLRTVDGYGAVENLNEIPASNYTCSVVVDADPDTSFMVGYEFNSQQARTRTVGSREEGCDRAARVASMMIATARARL